MTSVMTYPTLYNPPFPYRAKVGTFNSMTGTPESNAAVTTSQGDPMAFQMEYVHGFPLTNSYYLNGASLGYTCDKERKNLFLGAYFFNSTQQGNERGVNAFKMPDDIYKIIYNEAGGFAGLQLNAGPVPLNLELSTKIKSDYIKGKSTLSLLFGAGLSVNIFKYLDIGVRLSDLGLSHEIKGTVFKQDSNVSFGVLGRWPLEKNYQFKLGLDYTNYWWSKSQELLTGLQCDFYFPKPDLGLSFRAAYAWKDMPDIRTDGGRHDVLAGIRIEKVFPYFKKIDNASTSESAEDLKRKEIVYVDVTQRGILPLSRKDKGNDHNRPETIFQIGLKSEI